jgi:hypothetical protein
VIVAIVTGCGDSSAPTPPFVASDASALLRCPRRQTTIVRQELAPQSI